MFSLSHDDLSIPALFPTNMHKKIIVFMKSSNAFVHFYAAKKLFLHFEHSLGLALAFDKAYITISITK